ncbi:MAG: hypothetical protein OHK0024_24470 [Thalassobaculales bacterium]
MKPKSFLALMTVTALAAGGAWWGVQQRAASTAGEFIDQPLLPGLTARLNDVHGLQIAKAAEQVTLVRSGDTWKAPDKGDYPARFEKVRSLLVGLSQLKVAERKTADASLHDRLDLAPTEAKDSKSIRVTLLDAGGKTIADLFVGKQRYGGGGLSAGVYVRRAEESQTWLAKGDLEVRDPAVDWLDRGIVDLAGKRVAEARVGQPDGSIMVLTKAEADKEDFTLAGIPEGHKVSSQYSVNATAGVLERLTFDDVRRAEGLSFGEPVSTYRTHDGLTAAASFAEADGKTWLRLTVTAADGAAEEVRKEAAEISQKLNGWAYQLAEWKVNQIRRKMSELIEAEKQS